MLLTVVVANVLYTVKSTNLPVKQRRKGVLQKEPFPFTKNAHNELWWEIMNIKDLIMNNIHV